MSTHRRWKKKKGAIEKKRKKKGLKDVQLENKSGSKYCGNSKPGGLSKYGKNRRAHSKRERKTEVATRR